MNTEEKLIYVRKKRHEESHLYDNYVKYYEKEDFVKASEFLWGSITILTDALTILSGQKSGKHKNNYLFLKDLSNKEGKKGEMYSDYVDAGHALHSNFYHNWMTKEIFQNNIKKVEKLRLWLIKKLDAKEKEETLK